VNSLPTSVYWGIDEIARCWVIMESAISLWNGRGYGRGDGNRLGRGGGHNWNRHGNRSGHRNRHGSGDGSAWLDTAKQALHPPNGLNVNGGVFGTSGSRSFPASELSKGVFSFLLGGTGLIR
jgi:hypothetical protein